eukprot:COSAG02_NODE_1868_length_10593_cov_8.279648_8_plen_1889_part_01
MEALTAMGFPEHMCAKAMRMTGGDVEAAANYIMGAPTTAQPPAPFRPPLSPQLLAAAQQSAPLTTGAVRWRAGNLDQPEQWWFGPPGQPDALAQQLVAEARLDSGEDDEGPADTMEALLDGLEPERREAFAEAAVSALRALKAASAEQVAALGIDESHARLLREPLPPGRPVSPPDAADAPPPDVAASSPRDSPFLAAAVSASASSAIEQVQRLEEALGRARGPPRTSSPRVVAARAPSPSAAAAPNPALKELEQDGSDPPVYLLCGQGLEILDDGLRVRRAAAASSQHCWAATTSGRKYVEVVVESISSSLPSSSDADTDRRDPFGGGPADIMLSMLRGDGDGDPFGSPFGGPFGFGERPLRTRGLTRFGVRTDLEDLDVDGQLHEREGSRPGRATWMLHQKKIVKNGRGVANCSALMDNLRVGDRIGALVHNRSLTFYLNGKSQGVATSGLPSDARTLHFVVDMQGAVDSFRLLPEHTTPKTQEELEMGTIAGLIKSASLTVGLLAEKIGADADGREARAVDQEGRTALHFLCRDHPGTSAEMLSMLAQAYPDATSLADQSGKTPLLYLLGGDDNGAPKTVLDFATEAEYAQYLLPLCSAGAKLQAAKDLNHQVRLGTVGEYVDSNADKGVHVNWFIPADRRPGNGRRASRETREAGAFVFGADDDATGGDRTMKRWQSWSSVVLAHDDHEKQQAAAAEAKPEVTVEMIDALINANEKCVTEADSDGLLPVQVAERAGACDSVMDRLVQLSLAAGLVWCGGRAPTSMDADAAAADQYGIHVLLTSVTGTAVNASSSTLAKMAENAAHRSATRLHGLPFGVDEVKMSVCGPTHFVFLLKTGAVWRLTFKPLAGAAGHDSSGLNPQVSAAEQRIEAVRSQLSARRMRVRHIEAQINAAESKVFPVPASELQSLCDITRKPREECETVLRRLRPRASRMELAMHMLMGEQPEHNGQPAEFWEGDEVGRLQYELRKETKSIENDTKQIKEIQDSIESVSASTSAASATQAVVNPPVCVSTLEEWQLPNRHGSGTVAFTQLAVSQSTLLLLGENGILYRWDWNLTGNGDGDGLEGGCNDSPAPYRGEDPRAKELLQPLPRSVQESEGDTDPAPEPELEPEPESEVEVEDPIVQVSSSSWRTSVLTASGRVASWIDRQCHDAAKRKPPEAPAVVHNGVSCDKSGMSPIIGLRYKLKGKNYDVCEEEFAKLDDEEKLLYVRIAQPHGPEEEITTLEIEMANMAASASATGVNWAVGTSSPISILTCLEHRSCFPGLHQPPDDVDANQAEGNEAVQQPQEEQQVEQVVDIAVSNWGTIARTSKNTVYWWGRRPYNPSSAAAAAVPHSRAQGQSNIAKDFKAALSKYKAVADSEGDDSRRSGRGPSTSLSSLKKIKNEIFELAGDSDAYSARLMQLGAGTPGADALRSAVELYLSAASALSKGDKVVLCSSLDRPLYDVNTPVLLMNDNDTSAGAVAQTYFLQNPISRSRLQRERRVKVVDSSGSTKTVNIRDLFFLFAEYQPVEATVLKVDAQRGVVVLLPSQESRHTEYNHGGNAPTPIICDITDVTPIIAETAAVEKQLSSVVSVLEPCAIFTKQLLGSDMDGRLGSAIVSRSAESSATDSTREEHDLLSKFTIDSMTVSGWHATIMLSKDCRELWKFVADVSRACWTCAPSRLKLTAISNESEGQDCSDVDTPTPAVHIVGVKHEVVGLSTTMPVWVDDAGFVHSSSTTSSGQTTSDDSAAVSKLPRVRFLSTCIASGEAGSGDRSIGRWEFEEAPGSWRPYSASDCQRLDEAERKSQSSCELTFPYVVELRAKRQINRSTGRDRRIRQRPSASSSSGSSNSSSDAAGSGDTLAVLLGFEPTSGTESDDGSGKNPQFAGRSDLHDAVLDGLG